jgi:hypothetical protein
MSSDDSGAFNFLDYAYYALIKSWLSIATSGNKEFIT